MESWKVKIIDEIHTFGKKICIFRKLMNGDIEIYSPQQEISTIKKYGERIDENVWLSMSPEILQALVEELNEQGFKPKQGFLEGKLEATEKHMKDLRTFLKLKD